MHGTVSPLIAVLAGIAASPQIFRDGEYTLVGRIKGMAAVFFSGQPIFLFYSVN
jgi:hypothetical protein